MITNKKNKKNLLGILLACILIIDFCYLVSGLGLSTIYSEDYPLVMGPGETKNLEITLSSLEATKAKVNLASGSEIATIIDKSDEYDVTNSANINLKIEIPADIPEGTEYFVGLRAKTITPAGGMISTTSETGISFKVLVQKPVVPVTETPQEEGIGAGWIILGIVVIIALIIIIYFIIKSRKK